MGQSCKELPVWQSAVQSTIEIYKLTNEFPSSERFGLTNQLRRAAVSVASNIAEGYGRATKVEYVQFQGHARGSVSQVKTQLIFDRALNFGAKQKLELAESSCNEVGRMLGTMMKSLQSKTPSLVPLKESIAH